MNKSIFGTALLLATALSTTVTAGDEPRFDYPPSSSLEEVRGWVDRAPKGHPRLLASAADLRALIAELRDRVKEQFGLDLEEEVQYVGF